MLSGKLGTAYDEAWHVPLIVVDPSGRLTAHTDIPRDQLTSSADFMPPLVSLGNGGSRSWMRGDLARIYGERLDLVRLLSNPRALGRDHLVFATNEIVPATMNHLHTPTDLLGVQMREVKAVPSIRAPGDAGPAAESRAAPGLSPRSETYLTFVALSDAYFAKQRINERQVSRTFDYGLNM